jgi:asparagine synthase (glutamine-hydrolysing)
LDRLLRDSVKMRMEADVPLGAFLSGGIDSSTVVAFMQAQSGRPVKTFTIGFRDVAGEAGYARAVADHLGTEHTEMLVSSQDALNLIRRLPLIYDEPFADSSQIPTYFVSELARKHVTVSLSGDGGDEIFGGYSRYVWGCAAERWLHRMPRPLRSAMGGLLNRTPAGAGRALTRVASYCLPGLVKPHNPLGANGAEDSWLALSAIGTEPVATRAFPDWVLASALPGRSLVPNLMYMDAVRYLPDDILVKLDRASMAVSLESRVPLLDHRILEFAASLGVNPGLAAARNKGLLRRVLYRYVPPALIDRPKMGFGAPIRRWLRGPLREWAEDLIEGSSLASHGFVDAVAVRNMWSQYVAGKQNSEEQIWSVLMLQAWLQHTRVEQVAPLAATI